MAGDKASKVKVGKKTGRKPLAKGQSWDEMMQLRVNKDLKKKLMQAAKEAGDGSVSSYIRRMMIDHFKKKNE